MSEDLNQKKGFILNDADGFREYVDNKYLKRMTDAMFAKVFKSFWKFTFKLVDPDCDANRKVNFHLLLLMFKSRGELLLEEMDRKPDDFEVADNEATVGFVIAFLTFNTEVWKHLSEQNRTLINGKIPQKGFFKLIAWFLCENKEDYMGQLLAEDYCYYPDENELQNVVKLYKSAGLMGLLFDYFINLLSHSGQYTTAKRRMEEVILPYIDDMNGVQIDKVMEIMNSNSQLYDNYMFGTYCRMVVTKGLTFFTKDEIRDKYGRLIMPEE